jgi:hypothetical protein
LIGFPDGCLALTLKEIDELIICIQKKIIGYIYHFFHLSRALKCIQFYLNVAMTSIAGSRKAETPPKRGFKFVDNQRYE